MLTRPALVVRNRPIRWSPHDRRRQRFHRSSVSSSTKWPVSGWWIRQPTPSGFLQLFANGFRPDALPTGRFSSSNDGRPLLGHQFHGSRSYVFAQVKFTPNPPNSNNVTRNLNRDWSNRYILCFKGAKCSATSARYCHTVKNTRTSSTTRGRVFLR